MHFNVFSSGVKHGVVSEVDAAHIVVKDANRIRDGNAQVLQNSLEPYNFISATAAPLYSASVLDSATVGCFLLL